MKKTRVGRSGAAYGGFLPRLKKPAHPYEWMWEPLESDPTFLLRPMFGGKAAYMDGKLMLYFSAKQEPWRGVLICTSREHHGSLLAQFQDLYPHPVLGKWLYLPESAEGFERTVHSLVALAGRRDPRLGGLSPPRKRKKKIKPVSSRV